MHREAPGVVNRLAHGKSVRVVRGRQRPHRMAIEGIGGVYVQVSEVGPSLDRFSARDLLCSAVACLCRATDKQFRLCFEQFV